MLDDVLMGPEKLIILQNQTQIRHNQTAMDYWLDLIPHDIGNMFLGFLYVRFFSSI